MKEDIQDFIGHKIVVDTASNWIYLGTLEKITSATLVLRDADAHDVSDTDTTKERYIFDARTHGIKANRQQVLVSVALVTSVSMLAHVNLF